MRPRRVPAESVALKKEAGEFATVFMSATQTMQACARGQAAARTAPTRCAAMQGHARRGVLQQLARVPGAQRADADMAAAREEVAQLAQQLQLAQAQEEKEAKSVAALECAPRMALGLAWGRHGRRPGGGAGCRCKCASCPRCSAHARTRTRARRDTLEQAERERAVARDEAAAEAELARMAARARLRALSAQGEEQAEGAGAPGGAGGAPLLVAQKADLERGAAGHVTLPEGWLAGAAEARVPRGRGAAQEGGVAEL